MTLLRNLWDHVTQDIVYERGLLLRIFRPDLCYIAALFTFTFLLMSLRRLRKFTLGEAALTFVTVHPVMAVRLTVTVPLLLTFPIPPLTS